MTSVEWQNFLKRYELDRKDYSLKRFKKGLQIGSSVMKIRYIDYKNRQNGNQKCFVIGENLNNIPTSFDGFVPYVTDFDDL